MTENRTNAEIPCQPKSSTPRNRHNVLDRDSLPLEDCTYVNKKAPGGPKILASRKQPRLKGICKTSISLSINVNLSHPFRIDSLSEAIIRYIIHKCFIFI